MIRNRSFFVLGLGMMIAAFLPAFAQFDSALQPLQPRPSRKIQATSAEELIRKYHGLEGAIYHMSRDEWEVFRAWEKYDEKQVREIVHARKMAFAADREARSGMQKLLPPGDCDCWVEPDNSYEQITTFDWDFTAGAGVNVDCAHGPIDLGWQFNFYGQNFNQFYINSKGSISFGNYVIDWTPEEFPAAAYNQIAGFWADADYRLSGDIYYKVTPEAAYINFVDVGYYNNHTDLLNSYQIIITPNGGVILPDGNNTQLCYLNMQWAHGDVGGSGGCCGNNPATVGADKNTTTGNHIQYGRFNLLSADYNGPYGTTEAQVDGVDWLDYKVFNISTASSTGNTPPLPTVSLGCDTITLCQNGTYELDLDFLAPETNQTITVTSSAAPGWSVNVQNGAVGSVTGVFSALATNVGIHNITLTATDNGQPAETTTIEFVVEVLATVMPPLSIEGDLVICAGGETTISATPGFDSYAWSTGGTEQTYTHTYGGDFFVNAYLGACEATLFYDIEQTPYFLPDVFWDPAAICPDQVSIATVDPTEQPLYTEYNWIGNWDGGGGEVVSQSGPTAELTAGTFMLEVTNTEGCEGRRVFIIETVGSYIPEVSFEPFCDAVPASIPFSGGFSSPQDGTFLVYMFSNAPGGWGGSYFQITFNNNPSTTEILTSTGGFTQHNFPFTVGETVEVVFVPDPNMNTNLLSAVLYNCGNSNATNLSNMSAGVVYSGAALCSASPATGTWTQTAGPTGSFSVTNQYNTVFTPAGYGVYEICFDESICNVDYCYEIEINEEPTISLAPTAALACDGQPVQIVATVYDAAGEGNINWPNPGQDNVLQNAYSYANTTTANINVSVTNGCGTASAQATINSQFEPQPALEDESLCDGGTVLLDPISNDPAGLTYAWTQNGTPLAATSATYTVLNSGTYCVEVSNACYPAGIEACADVSIVAPIPNPLEAYSVDCIGNGYAVIVPEAPADYSFVWPDGSTENTWTIQDGSVYDGTDVCVSYTDPFGCETNEACTYLWIGLPPTINPLPVLSGPLTLCPEVVNVFDLNPQYAGEYEWFINCGSDVISFPNALEQLDLVSSMLPMDCWGSEVTLTALAINPCAVNGVPATWEVIVDACALTIPNVFTPGNGDDMNASFQIEGLDVYNDALLQVFNRWGQVVYRNEDYKSGDWLAGDVEDGTYWYTLLLPNGIAYSGNLTILR